MLAARAGMSAPALNAPLVGAGQDNRQHQVVRLKLIERRQQRVDGGVVERVRLGSRSMITVTIAPSRVSRTVRAGGMVMGACSYHAGR